MSDYPQRKWTRLKDYDYSKDGYYFLTICTKDKQCILSDIRVSAEGDPAVILTDIGEIAEAFIKTIPGIENYVIMPNHVHLILHKTNGKSIASDVRSFKGLTSKRIGKSIWQDYFYDHVIRDEADFQTKWQYIDANPSRWAEDEYWS